MKTFGIVGQSLQLQGGDSCPNGYIEMKGARPDNHSVASANGEWIKGGYPILTCSKRQGELALLEIAKDGFPSLLHWVENLIETEKDPIEKRKMQAYFNAPEWKSNDPFVLRMWELAGLALWELEVTFNKAKEM